MAGKDTRSWQDIRRQKPMNEKRVTAYERLMAAEQLIAEARTRRGVSDDAIINALAASEPEGASIDQADLYLSTLARYVEALGGHLELRAVFPEEAIVVPP